ncbi:MAG TPA: SO2930 family diheme c-type cytochrome [Saprospiraceae bacterium]|nr:SO2930 family diheme c-type cytochrome [Saprospiraceae bacterium]HMQ82832.1 SO2930 family diheme c-type cytochrome [Saprospiraceae bacterium]
MPVQNRWRWSILLIVGGLLYACKSPTPLPESVQFDPEQVPYAQLSDYHFFTWKKENMLPNERVIPYEPITPLFSDYAFKSRYVWIAPGSQASIDSAGVLQFPDHTVLIKHFYYPADFRHKDENWDLVETRLLVKKEGQWSAYTYIWNEQDTEAALSPIGDLQQVHWKDEKGIAQMADYLIPNKNQCKSCHQRDQELLPIGTKAAYLNWSYAYSPTQTANQLHYWQASGLLAPDDFEKFAALPDWDDPNSASLEDRALAYLEVNCGHCHHPKGSAHTTGLYLGMDFKSHPHQLGYCKPPVAAGKGSGGRKYSIVPGQPDSSILAYRMESNDPGIMMPEIGRAVAHDEGIALIREWIRSLEAGCK